MAIVKRDIMKKVLNIMVSNNTKLFITKQGGIKENNSAFVE